jgi:hypothetical protein
MEMQDASWGRNLNLKYYFDEFQVSNKLFP